ncbi:MAG: S-layer homology domain-containing protein [Paenibacillus sp.]|uniref:S-layer homology domain-containing protein n=1 Tax=Paenibacillus sp. TaxID=58172 RepID=UPI002904DDD9|nr:S-layer homology domain-containing protein [Paenibacillus sp.]MDU2243383.1 S-layer homology domain-containing protein [Paenibacillus sp.]
MKKWVNLALSSAILGGTLLSGLGAGTSYVNADAQKVSTVVQSFTDLGHHWAAPQIEKWSARGVIQGNQGEFEPERALTRAEWVALINRAFQLPNVKSTPFADVKETDWYASEVHSAAAAGYIKGFANGSFQPTADLSREQAALTLAKLLGLQQDVATVSFKDEKEISSWSKSSVYSAVNHGLMRGYDDQTYRPKAQLTRAEAVVMLDRAIDLYGAWYGEAGEYGPKQGEATEKLNGHVIISAPGITLRNVEIAGDLVIGEGVGEGDVNLDHVTVHGTVKVYGGGENSIHLNNSVLLNVIVNKNDGTVRLVAQGSTSIQEVTVKTGANLEAEKGVTVNKVSLTNELPTDSKVRLSGYFNTVNVEAYSLSLEIPEGSIGSLNISPEAADATLDTGKEAEILQLVLNAAAKITGIGTISTATINSTGVSFDKAPAKIKVGDQVAEDVTVQVGEKELKAVDTSKPAPDPSPSTNTNTPIGSVSNGGDSTNGGSNQNGSSPGGNTKPDVSPWPVLSTEQGVVSVTEAVYFTSDQDGTAYLLSRMNAYWDLNTAELAVKSGDGLTKNVKAGQRTYFDTSRLQNISFPSNYGFAVVVFNAAGKYAVKDLDILNETEAIRDYPVVAQYGGELEYFSLIYNRTLELSPGKTTEGIIQIALDGTEDFKPFDASMGQVEIRDNKIYIRPLSMNLGKNFKFRLIEQSVVTKDSQFNTEFTTGNMNFYIHITLLSHGGGKNAMVKVGDEIEFSVADEGTVYLVPDIISGSKETFDEKVEEGFGKKIEVTTDEVGKSVRISTEGLSPGEYNLMVWGGHSVYITLSE